MMRTIPTTDHASLNLAQAVLIALYELHLAADDVTRKLAPPRKVADPPSSEHFELTFADTQKALSEIQFFKTRNDEHVMRSLRTLVYRAAPDSRELDLIRAIAIEVVRTLERERRSRSEPLGHEAREGSEGREENQLSCNVSSSIDTKR